MTTVTPPETQPSFFAETEDEVQEALPWQVILFNDDLHGFDEVIHQVQKATGCRYDRATEITFEAHSKGQTVCYVGDLESCKKVARILEEIHLLTEIVQAEQP